MVPSHTAPVTNPGAIWLVPEKETLFFFFFWAKSPKSQNWRRTDAVAKAAVTAVAAVAIEAAVAAKAAARRSGRREALFPSLPPVRTTAPTRPPTTATPEAPRRTEPARWWCGRRRPSFTG